MRYFYPILTTFSLFLFGCNYLDFVPEKDIETIETIFEKREGAERWLKTCHSFLNAPLTSLVKAPGFLGADEMVVGDYIRNSPNYAFDPLFIGDGLQMVQEPYCNVWTKTSLYAGIRYCNIFFEEIDRPYNMEEAEKKLWIAEVKALKAHFYFELMRRYGPIILVPENIPANASIGTMQQYRSPINICVDEIVKLLNEAIKDLPPLQQKDMNRWGFHSLESAMTLKAQVLFYAASPLFNGNKMFQGFKNKKGEELFDVDYDPEKWKIAAMAIDSAISVCLDNGKRLILGNASKGTALLNVMADIEKSVLAANFENNEAILMLKPSDKVLSFWHRWTLPYFQSTFKEQFNDNVYGCMAPSMKMVEMYYTEHGLPITEDKEWDYSSRYQMDKEASPVYRDVVPLNSEVLGLHLRREPRFYAHIAADRTYWQRGQLPKHNLLVEAYQGERFGSQSAQISSSVRQNMSGYWLKKGTYSDVTTKEYTEVVERKEEAVVAVRLAELYLMKAEAWNEYEGPLVEVSHVYEPLNEVRRRAGIPSVEDAWNTYAKNPGKIKTKEGMRDIIRQEWSIEFAFEGRRFWNLRRWLIAHEELNTKLYGWNIIGENAQEFYNNFEGPIVVWAKRKFTSPRDYLFPIRSEEVVISGCVQNPGW